MPTPPPKPQTDKPADSRTVVNDAVRRDGGKPTDDQPVPAEQIERLERTAIDHTVDEPGS
jgi:hypothetical protein